MCKPEKQKERRKRIYARYFDWYDKPRKELGIVEDLLTAMNLRNEYNYHSPEISKRDPPDCILYDEQNNICAVEVTELVSKSAVSKAEQGIPIIRIWRLDEIVDEIGRILKKKDNKKYQGGPYDKIIVVIHTDEPSITYGSLKEAFQEVRFSECRQVDEVYLIISFDPKELCCPYIKIICNNSVSSI